MRPPGFRDPLHLLRFRQLRQPVLPLHRGPNPQIRHRQHILPPQCEHEEHLHRPDPDPLHRRQMRDHRLVVHRRQRLEIHRPGPSLLRQVPHIRRLLPRKPNLAQPSRLQRQNPFRCHRFHRPLQPTIDRGRRLPAQLLRNNRPHYRLERRRPISDVVIPPLRNNRCKDRIFFEML